MNGIGRSIHRSEMAVRLLFLQLLLLYLPEWKLFSLYTDNGEIPASLCYVFCIVFVPFLLGELKGRELTIPCWWITALVLYVIVHAAICMPRYGVSKSILHWLFGAYLLLVMLNVGRDLGWEQWRRLLEAGAVCFAVMHFLFLLKNHTTVQTLLSGYFLGTLDGYSGSMLPSLTRGGRNLDCTWLALGGFFVQGRKKPVYVTYILLFAFLGCSRSGIMAIAVLILWSLVYDPRYHLTKDILKWYILYAVIILAVLFCSGMGQAFLIRSMIDVPAPGRILGLKMSADNGSQYLLDIYGSAGAASLSGRAAIWKMVPQVFLDHPWGYGVGNAMRVMKTSYGFFSYEDVVHNVFFQWLLDEGVIGGLWYLGLVIAFLYRQWKQRPHFFQTPLDGYFAAYLLLSLVQFHGGEALMIFVLGIYLLQAQGVYRLHLPFSKRSKEP